MKLICALTLALATLSIATPAHADSKLNVFVAPFEGAAKLARQSRRAVVDAVGTKHALVDDARAADAIVTGTVRKRGRRATLKVVVKNAATQETIDTLRVPLRGNALPAKVRRTLRDDVLDLLVWIEPKPPVRAQPERQPRKAAPAKKTASPEPEPETETEPQTSATLSEPASTDDALHADRRRMASVHAGLGMVGRDLTFDYDEALTPGQRPTIYDGGMVGAVALEGDVRPFATTDKLRGIAGGHLEPLAVTFSFDRAVGLTSRFVTDGMEDEFDTTQQHWGLGLAYRYDVGPVGIVGALGYNALTHEVDNGDVDINLPDVDYRYVDFGAGVRYPVTARIELGADARLLHVMAAGEIVEAEAYGRAGVGGVDVDAGVDVRITDRIAVRGGVHYLGMSFDFEGTGTMATDLDGDPDQDVTSASDTYLGGYVLAGYAF